MTNQQQGDGLTRALFFLLNVQSTKSDLFSNNISSLLLFPFSLQVIKTARHATAEPDFLLVDTFRNGLLQSRNIGLSSSALYYYLKCLSYKSMEIRWK